MRRESVGWSVGKRTICCKKGFRDIYLITASLLGDEVFPLDGLSFGLA